MTSRLSSSSSSSSSAISAHFQGSAESAPKKAPLCSSCIEQINSSVVEIFCGKMEKDTSSQSDQPFQLCLVCEKPVEDPQNPVEDPIVTIFKDIFVKEPHKPKMGSPNSPREEKTEEPASPTN